MTEVKTSRDHLSGTLIIHQRPPTTTTVCEQYTNKDDAEAPVEYSTLELVWTPEIAGSMQKREIPIWSERNGNVPRRLQGLPGV